jgi:hypothetical protein
MVSESEAITSSGVSDHSQLKQLQENDYSSNEGRNYHRSEEVAYVLPNDDDGTKMLLFCDAFYILLNEFIFLFCYLVETGRLNQQHWMLKYVLQW